MLPGNEYRVQASSICIFTFRPPFRRAIPEWNKLFATYGKAVEFIVVYVMEAHASDGSQWIRLSG